MKLFFDMEFTGLRQNTTPISIGIVSEDGKKFYAEFTDYDKSQCDDWIKDNVINKLKFELELGEHFWEREHDRNVEAICNRECVSYWLNKWLSQFDTIQFVSDVCHYDFVLLIDLLTNGGTALDLPENISAVCHDLNMDIARHYHVSDREAFDMSREQIMFDVCNGGVFVDAHKHNSLYDANIIRAIYEVIGYDI